MMHFTVPADHGVKIKEVEKRNNIKTLPEN